MNDMKHIRVIYFICKIYRQIDKEKNIYLWYVVKCLFHKRAVSWWGSHSEGYYLGTFQILDQIYDFEFEISVAKQDVAWYRIKKIQFQIFRKEYLLINSNLVSAFPNSVNSYSFLKKGKIQPPERRKTANMLCTLHICRGGQSEPRRQEP